MSASSDLLLVEDDLLLARALQRGLLARGLRARHIARCGAAAALRGPFGFGLFDIDLPDGDGVELARLLLLRGIVAKVAFYTACSQPGRLARARELGPLFVKSGSVCSLIDHLLPRLPKPGPQATLNAF
jgi:DNA-binding response OmpR family regulator